MPLTTYTSGVSSASCFAKILGILKVLKHRGSGKVVLHSSKASFWFPGHAHPCLCTTDQNQSFHQAKQVHSPLGYLLPQDPQLFKQLGQFLLPLASSAAPCNQPSPRNRIPSSCVPMTNLWPALKAWPTSANSSNFLSFCTNVHLQPLCHLSVN